MTETDSNVVKAKNDTPRKTKSKDNLDLEKAKAKEGLQVNAEAKMFGALSSVLKQGELTDLTVILHESSSAMSSSDPNSKSIKVHRLVLAAMSEPLREKIESDVIVKDVITLTVENIPAFENLLDYVYGKRFFISKQHILNVLQAAVTWRVHALRDKCVAYLINVVDLETATTILKAAERSNLEKLGEAAANTIARNLCKIKNKKQYFDAIPDTAFKKIFSRAALNTPPTEGELAIVDLIFARTKDTEADRKRTDDLLTSCVKFVDLTDRQLLTLALDNKFHSQCRRKIILDAISVNKFPTLIHQVAKEMGEECLNHFQGAPYLQHRVTDRPHKRWLSSIFR
mmetsp:Transcript_4910/g.6207  ORF Transcript_4910/g.6207 Transcript_4910/m.6207 type:complete len:342 (-) Transcript_4910:596-1621(-)